MTTLPKKIYIDKAFIADEEINPGTASIRQEDRIDLDKYISKQIANGSIVIDIGGDGETTSIEEVGTIKDSDFIMLAKVSQDNTYLGFQIIRAGKLMRIIRGLPLDALTHLVGLGYKTTSNDTIINVPNNSTGALEVYDTLPLNLRVQ